MVPYANEEVQLYNITCPWQATGHRRYAIPAPTDFPSSSDLHFKADTQEFFNMVLQSIPATEQFLAQIKDLQFTDRACVQVKQYCQTQWPNRTSLSKEIIPYYLIHSRWLTIEGSPHYNPAMISIEILDKLHHGNLGITKCWARPRQSAWWPGLAALLIKLRTA